MDNLTKLRYWTFKILPLVYDDSLSYYEVLTKVTAKVNELVDSNNTMPQAITDEITKQLNESYATDINDKINKLANEVYAKLITAIATDEGTNTFTKDAKSGGELIFLNGTLYKVTAVMSAGTNYIIGTNIVPVNISEELRDIKETYLSSNNEHWNERSANNYNEGVYLFWKDVLYITTKDIHTNDILYIDGDNKNLKQVTLASEITSHYNEMHKADNNLQTQINSNDADIEKLQTEQNNQANRISNIIAQSGNDNTEIVDGRTWASRLGTKSSTTIGDAIRSQINMSTLLTPLNANNDFPPDTFDLNKDLENYNNCVVTYINAKNEPINCGTILQFSAVPHYCIVQLVIGSDERLYTRYKLNSSANWSNWRTAISVEKDSGIPYIRTHTDLIPSDTNFNNLDYTNEVISIAGASGIGAPPAKSVSILRFGAGEYCNVQLGVSYDQLMYRFKLNSDFPWGEWITLDTPTVVNDKIQTAINSINDKIQTAINSTNDKIQTAINSIKMPNITSYIHDNNNNKYILSVENGLPIAIPVVPRKIMYIGNSFLVGFKSAPNPMGMAASKQSEDYYHRVNTKCGLTEVQFAMSGTGYESQENIDSAKSWIANNITNNSEIPSDCDLAIVQLGENSNTTAKNTCWSATFKDFIVALKAKCPKARIGIVAGYWSSTETIVETTAKTVAKETGSVFIDCLNMSSIEGSKAKIGDVYTLPNSTTIQYNVDSWSSDNTNKTVTINFTKDNKQYSATMKYDSITDNGGVSVTVTGPEQCITDYGVAMHPSSKGFELIANKIIESLEIE